VVKRDPGEDSRRVPILKGTHNPDKREKYRPDVKGLEKKSKGRAICLGGKGSQREKRGTFKGEGSENGFFQETPG